ncbi:hypothetical protein LK542_10085 [Massilia sp. IC2-477]|uniref:hypothetical protein n=1 Tax=Massilia sp. IC2-477 TaxID=2887198 RepID=UPI001D110CB2|nr:hypothetical protein [Massilia sp. IC2-477]MCC2955962.1 hypothetical protein [Massilia sp. IC2-477]
MDANQRSEFNNQTNNGANEKWTPGSKGNTQSGPMDHTYPQGPGQQSVIRGENEMRPTDDPARMGQQEVAAEDGGRADYETTLPGAVPDDLPGGSLQSQQTGGSGPQQGITDSHQRQMEQRSGAWGLLEQPVGHRDRDSGTDLRAHPANQQGNSQAVHDMNPHDARQPELQGGSLGRHHGVAPGTYESQGTTAQVGYGNKQSAASQGEGTGMAVGPHPTNQQRRER